MNQTFLNPQNNDNLYHLRGIELRELLAQIQTYFLEYREILNLPKDLTFGVEIEYEGILKTLTDKFVNKNLPSWDSKQDGSLCSGGEISSPVMTDEKGYWQELKKICDYLSKRGADTFHNAGGHIHIGTSILGSDIEAWKTFLKLYMAYEGIIFRFIYGDKISGRSKMLKYAPPIADSLHKILFKINDVQNIHELRNELPTSQRYAALNFQNVAFYNPSLTGIKNTLEFRSPNATTNAVVWQNNINAFAKMLLSAKQGVINTDFLDYKLSNEFLPYSENKYSYNDVSLKNVLEFVDLVFDNNLDKIYFLRQYLKNFQENYGAKTAIKAKKFVK